MKIEVKFVDRDSGKCTCIKEMNFPEILTMSDAIQKLPLYVIFLRGEAHIYSGVDPDRDRVAFKTAKETISADGCGRNIE